MPQEDYSISYSDKAKANRDALPENARSVMFAIGDLLAADPDKYPHLTEDLGQNMYIYKHDDPAVEVTYVVDRERRKITFLHIVALAFEPPKLLFISYSHENEQWLKEIAKFLNPLNDKGIEWWADTRIKPGDDWQEKIAKALSSAKAGILLVSQEFLSSDFIAKKELPYLLEARKTKGLKVSWIALSSSTVNDTGLADIQAINDPKKPLDTIQNPGEMKKQLLEIYEKIKESLN